MNLQDRRGWLKLAAASAATLWLPKSAWSQPKIGVNPFTLGVASGSPTHDSVVLWTRLHVPGDLALGEDEVGDDPEHAVQDHEDLDERPEDELHVGVVPDRGHGALRP